jgi:CDP-diglyceride synthetase
MTDATAATEPPVLSTPPEPVPVAGPKPYWFPDTQGFLAAGIMTLISLIVMLLLVRPPAIDERTSGVLMTIVGVLIACLKDVFAFFFGSSRGSEKKDDIISPPPVVS